MARPPGVRVACGTRADAGEACEPSRTMDVSRQQRAETLARPRMKWVYRQSGREPLALISTGHGRLSQRRIQDRGERLSARDRIACPPRRGPPPPTQNPEVT